MSSQEFVIGPRAAIEAVKAQKSIDKVFIQKGAQGHLIKELQELLHRSKVNYVFVPVEKLNRMVRGVHQGVVATVSPVVFQEIESLVEEALKAEKPPLFLLLDQVSDVRNFGAIIRTAECAGVTAIVIQNTGNAPVTPDTVKTSAGAVFKVPICKVDHLKDALFYLQSMGIKIIAATEKADKTLYEVSFKEAVAIVLGAEDFGISPSILKAADVCAKLPMLGNIASLNVSVAGGLFLYESVRQRYF